MEDVQWYDKTELMSAVQLLQQNPDEAMKSRWTLTYPVLVIFLLHMMNVSEMIDPDVIHD